MLPELDVLVFFLDGVMCKMVSRSVVMVYQTSLVCFFACKQRNLLVKECKINLFCKLTQKVSDTARKKVKYLHRSAHDTCKYYIDVSIPKFHCWALGRLRLFLLHDVIRIALRFWTVLLIFNQ